MSSAPKTTNKMLALYVGSPPPYSIDYQIGIIDVLFNYTTEELEKEYKRRLKLYRKDLKDYYNDRKKELDELEFLLEEKK